jgi:hypothetical protein
MQQTAAGPSQAEVAVRKAEQTGISDEDVGDGPIDRGQIQPTETRGHQQHQAQRKTSMPRLFCINDETVRCAGREIETISRIK